MGLKSKTSLKNTNTNTPQQTKLYYMMSVLSEIYSPTFHHSHRRTKKTHMTKVRLALSRVAVQYRKKNNKRHQENVRKNLKVVQDFIINTPKSKPLVLGINTHDLVQDEAQEEHDLAILHLRSPMLNGSNRRTTTKDDDDDNDDDNGEERDMAVLDSYQLLMPRYSFNGNERKQHFFLDVMDSTNTTDVVANQKKEEEEEVHDACHDETKYNDNNNDDNNRKSKKKKRYMMHVMTRQNTMIRMIIIIKEEEGKKT